VFRGVHCAGYASFDCSHTAYCMIVVADHTVLLCRSLPGVQFPSVDDIMSALPRSWRTQDEEDQARVVLKSVVDKLK